MRLRMLLACLLVVASTASAAVTVQDIKPGTAASGDQLTKEELNGKILLAVFWGTR